MPSEGISMTYDDGDEQQTYQRNKSRILPMAQKGKCDWDNLCQFQWLSYQFSDFQKMRWTILNAQIG